MQKIKPIKPAAPYVGGKRILAKTIIEHINHIPHKSYVEPFCGMGGVFFRRDQKPPCEVINDYNGEISNFFRILQRHYVSFIEMMKFSITSRREFERLADSTPETLTDLERAARFLYLQRTAFGGRVTRQGFGVSKGTSSRFNCRKLEPLIENLNERLSGVVIENLEYAECIQRYDSPDTLFYLDPPYWGSESEYGAGLFGRDDFVKLADLLSTIKGKFILSLNDTSEIREIFKAFSMEHVSVKYTITRRKSKSAKELIIKG